MKKSIMSTVVLVAICSVMALLLAATNLITAPIIQKNQDAAANQALLEVMPEGEDFEKVDITDSELPATVTEVYKEKNGGYVVRMTTSGYGSGMVIMCGIAADGTVTGTVCLASTETLGYEKTFGASFIGKDAAGVEAVDTVVRSLLVACVMNAAARNDQHVRALADIKIVINDFRIPRLGNNDGDMHAFVFRARFDININARFAVRFRHDIDVVRRRAPRAFAVRTDIVRAFGGFVKVGDL